ncbi:hypothetical protein ACHQM5_013467 [Ranunculus cassubicifolius]
MASSNKFSLAKLPSTSNIISACTFVGASAVLFRTIIEQTSSIVNEIKALIPHQLQSKLCSLFGRFFPNPSPKLVLKIRENNNHVSNQIYEASEIYLRTKSMDPSLERLGVSKHERETALIVTIEKDQEIVDVFEGIRITWQFVHDTGDEDNSRSSGEGKYYDLTFLKEYKEIVLNSYLPYVLKTSKEITEEDRTLKLYSTSLNTDYDNGWGSIALEHPATFDTLAMDEDVKKQIRDDLDRFVKRRELYKRVGKPWKRGYLLYGPPGTGKSSLIAAMANYLRFHVYDLELSSVYNNSDFRRLLLASKNRSILVIEDIDCSVNLTNRDTKEEESDSDTEGSYSDAGNVTLSGLLNFIDGLWSSCGDERVIVFTSNYKDRLDPALLRPGRMDMHIHMGYCTPCGFKILANNYLQIESHPLFEEICILLKDVNATPAEVAEELMKSDDPESCLKEVIGLLHIKKTEQKQSKKEEGNAQAQEKGEVGSELHGQEEDDDEKVDLEKES